MRAKRLRVVIPVALVALLAVFALVGALVRSGVQGNGVEATTAERTAPGAADGSYGANAVPMPASGALDAVKAAEGGDQTASQTFADVPPAASPAAHYLIRNGSITLTVKRHELRDAMQRVGTITLGMGGYVLSSYMGGDAGSVGPVEPMALDATAPSSGTGSGVSTEPGTYKNATGSGDVVQYGTITVRVPEAKFDTAVERFAALGEVVDMTTSADDVSDQMVDLRARLRHARAVELRLLGFLDRARNIRETLAVQDRIDRTQLTVEQLSAEIARMSEVTSYGTITVSLHERGVPRPGSIDESDSFWGAFTNSLHLIADGAKASAVALGALLPFLALAVAVALAVRYARRAIARRRPPQTPQAPVAQS
jgi:hypothetical protein